MAVPKSTKALVLRKSTTDKKPVYHDAVLVDKALPALEEGQILVHIRAVAFNHRDVCTFQETAGLLRLTSNEL